MRFGYSEGAVENFYVSLLFAQKEYSVPLFFFWVLVIPLPIGFGNASSC